jgi:hypothetical protein
MHWLAIGVTLSVSAGIVALGAMYLVDPSGATRSFGLPLPGDGPNIAWWLRLKGVRDVVSGLLLFALYLWGGAHLLGIALLILALIPAGDMGMILAARGSTARAVAIHGLTAAMMVAAAMIVLEEPA